MKSDKSAAGRNFRLPGLDL